MVDIGVSFAKYAVFFVNFLFVALGIAMIAVGPLVYNRVIEYDDVLEGAVTAFPILLIISGVVVFLIAFLGCCGAIKENRCMLFTFSIILMAIVIFEVGVVAGAYAKKDDLNDLVNKGLNKTLTEYNNKEGFRKTWHALQTEMKCCGIDRGSDWYSVLGDNKLPGACCNKALNDNTCTSANQEFTKGCKQATIDFVKNNLLIVAGIGVGAAVLQLFQIVFSCCLYSAYRRGHA